MNRAQRGRLGATPRQLAIVGVLAIVLAWVLASNFRGSSEEPVSSTDPAPSVATEAPTAGADAASPQAAGRPGLLEENSWPAYSLVKLIRFDPLAAPEWLGESDQASDGADASAKTLEQLQSAENAIILVTDDQRIARIGTQEYRVGDMVGNLMITDISSAGIVFGEPQKGAPATPSKRGLLRGEHARRSTTSITATANRTSDHARARCLCMRADDHRAGARPTVPGDSRVDCADRRLHLRLRVRRLASMKRSAPR